MSNIYFCKGLTFFGLYDRKNFSNLEINFGIDIVSFMYDPDRATIPSLYWIIVRLNSTIITVSSINFNNILTS